MHIRNIIRKKCILMAMIYVKYLILIVAFWAAFRSIQTDSIAAGITAAGAFIGFALIEIQDLKVLNKEEKEV